MDNVNPFFGTSAELAAQAKQNAEERALRRVLSPDEIIFVEEPVQANLFWDWASNDFYPTV